MEFNQELYKQIKQNTYICSCCGNIIFPIIKDNDIYQEKTDMRGGIGNKILKRNICNGCVSNFSIFSNEKWRMNNEN